MSLQRMPRKHPWFLLERLAPASLSLVVRAMNIRFLLLLFLAFAANARPRYGSAVQYGIDNSSYALIAVTDRSVFLELRTFEEDRVIENVVLSSRYMPPEFTTRDAAVGESPEFIIRTRDGGTGFAETHCAIYGITRGHIRKLGDFVVARSAESWPTTEYSETLTGKVSFPKKGELIYRYTQSITKQGKTTTTSMTQRFLFNSTQMKYEKAKKP
jgi:hypothetical protein